MSACPSERSEGGLSPDTKTQLPDFTQSYNKYSYVLNNPLKYTDPTGMIGVGGGGGGGGSNGGLSGPGVHPNIITDVLWGTSGYSDLLLNESIDDGDWGGGANGGGASIGASGGGHSDRDKENTNANTRGGNGYIDFSKAVEHYNYGNGQPLQSDANKIDYANFSMSRFDNPDGYTNTGDAFVFIKFAGRDFVNTTQALVYGTVTAVQLSGSSFFLLPDTYNFDVKLQPGSFVRDVETMYGGYINSPTGQGKPFEIDFYGIVHLNK